MTREQQEMIDRTQLVADGIRDKAKHSISPYPDNVRSTAKGVFVDGRYVGYADQVNDGLGNTYLARPIKGENEFCKNKTEAVLYIVRVMKGKD